METCKAPFTTIAPIELNSASGEPPNQSQCARNSQHLKDAIYAALTARAVSDAAKALIDDLQQQVTDDETRAGERVYKRGKKAEQFRKALEGLTGDLVR